VKIRESKFGMALVIESSQISGGYILGFRIDPVNKLHEVQKEISSLHVLYSANPIFGIQHVTQMDHNQAALPIQDNMDELDEIDDLVDESSDAFAAYVTEKAQKDREIVFNRDLGLAMESLKDGFTLENLWSILPNENSKKHLLD